MLIAKEAGKYPRGKQAFVSWRDFICFRNLMEERENSCCQELHIPGILIIKLLASTV
jgi:hypothetical protein